MVKVSYAALNPADVHFMLHLSNWIPFRHNPHPGLDFVGTVVQAGPSAELEVGAEVGGAVNVSSVAFGKGSLAEYIVIPSDIVARRPKSLEMRQAAGALGVAGQTTALVLGEANVKAGDKVLVNGASGGVGSVLVQIVKGLGATVYGVCSEANADMVKRLGADHIIDYKAHKSLYSFLTQEHGDAPFNLMIDCVGDQPLFTESTKYLRPEGLFICIVGGRSQGIVPYFKNKILPVALGGTPRQYRILGLSPSGAFAGVAAKWANDGLLKEIPIDMECPLENAIQGYERVVSKRSRGKVVVKVS